MKLSTLIWATVLGGFFGAIGGSYFDLGPGGAVVCGIAAALIVCWKDVVYFIKYLTNAN